MHEGITNNTAVIKKFSGDYIIILCIGLALLAVSHFYVPHKLAWGDEIVTATEAQNLINGHGFVSNFTVPENILAAQHLTSDVHMPGMALAIALAYKLFLVSEWAAMLPSQIAYLTIGVMLFWLGKKYASRSAGITAACLFFIFPPMLVYAHSAMTELMIMLFATAWCACLFSYTSSPRLGSILGISLLLICGTLFRETFLVFLPITVWALIKSSSKMRAINIFVFAITFMSLFFAIIVPFFLTKGLYPHSLTLFLDLPGFGQKIYYLINNIAPNIRDFFWQSAYPQQLMAWPIAAITVLIVVYRRHLQPNMQKFFYVYLSAFLLLFILVCLLYRFDYWSGVRVLLMCMPIACIILGAIFTQKLFKKIWTSAIIIALVCCSLALLAFFSHSRKQDLLSQQDLTRIIPHINETGQRIALIEGAFRYGWEQYPTIVIWQAPKDASTFIQLHALLPMHMIMLNNQQQRQLQEDANAVAILSTYNVTKIDSEKFFYYK